MKPIFIPFFLISLSASVFSCNNNSRAPTTLNSPAPTLAEARRGFKTKLVKFNRTKTAVETPPKGLFSIIAYPTSIGKMAAYLGQIPNDGKLHPALIWISGGFGNDIGDVWTAADAENDQSAAVFRKAGLVMMYPAQRGGNRNPGYDETCYGEIDDILAAADFLAQQKGIDPRRIYLAGHSTGGTKVLLTAECTNKFRAVFSFGPVSDILDYGVEYLTYDTSDMRESRLRAPALWVASIKTPVFIFEGDAEPGNIVSLREMEKIANGENNQYIHFYEIKNKTHFSELQPISKIVAKKIMEDDKPDSVKMDFSKEAAVL